MSNEILIESGPHELRVAALEDGRLVEVHIERATALGVVGNLYKGRVSRVVPAIQAAFVDIGLARDAFLFAGDLRREEPMDLPVEERPQRVRPDHHPIAEQVKEGQELLVQVVKEPLPGKGARISSQVSLPGRFLVLLPDANGVGVSRRISDSQERLRLDEEVRSLLPEGHGAIVRTAAVGGRRQELERDLESLLLTWRETRDRAAGIGAPGLVRREGGLVERVARDLLVDDISAIWIEGASARATVEGYLSRVDAEMLERVRPHEGDEALFASRGVDAAIAKAMRSRVWLNSGGFLVINPTEALVAIDVNSGRNTEASELEATALETNLEAAEEVARQVRLRDLAGIIVVDFIDMVEAENRAELETRLEAALRRDRTRTQISQMSDFGLIAVTRKRTRGGLLQSLTQVCPCCSGEGRVKDAFTVGLELERTLRRRFGESHAPQVEVRVDPRTKRALEDHHGDLLVQIAERLTGGPLELTADETLGIGDFEIDTR